MKESKTVLKCDFCGKTIWEGNDKMACDKAEMQHRYCVPVNYYAGDYIAKKYSVTAQQVDLCDECAGKIADCIESALNVSLVQYEGLHIGKTKQDNAEEDK